MFRTERPREITIKRWPLRPQYLRAQAEERRADGSQICSAASAHSVPTEGWAPADSGPLGLAGFAMTTFALSMFKAKLVRSGGEPVVLGLAVASVASPSSWPACGSPHGTHSARSCSRRIARSYMFVASLRTTGAVAVGFFQLSIMFIVLGAGSSGAHENVIKGGGYVGLVTSVVAGSASFAAVTNLTFGRMVLPVMPLKRLLGPSRARHHGGIEFEQG